MPCDTRYDTMCATLDSMMTIFVDSDRSLPPEFELSDVRKMSLRNYHDLHPATIAA